MMNHIFPQNFVPLPYRHVSVQPYDGEMSEAAIEAHLLGKDSYRRTNFVILEAADACAIAAVDRVSDKPLFSQITAVSVLALPDSCHLVADSTVDTGNPSALAAKARELGIDETMTLVVRGMDSHVNFIYQPKPIKIRIVDVIPPEPAKLYRMAQQILTYADLPAIELVPELVHFHELAEQAPDAEAYLIPCRASGLELNAPTYFLDERPSRQPWTMVACERSRQIHRHFYDDEAPCIEMCPRERTNDDGSLQLIKCCLLEEHLEQDGHRAIVPWGANLKQVETALRSLVEIDEQ